MRGQKWMNEASYLNDTDRERIMARVSECRHALRQIGTAKPSSVGVRPAGIAGSIAAVTYGPGGGSLYCLVAKWGER